MTVSSKLSRKDSLSVMFSILAIALLVTTGAKHIPLEARSVEPNTNKEQVMQPLSARELLRLKRKERSDAKNVRPAAPVKSAPEPVVNRPSARSIKEKGGTYSSAPFFVPVILEKAGCGDQLILSPETCDDGNKNNGDGCNSACQTETGFVCNSKQPSTCREVCGSGGVSVSESCDDGNLTSGDGCNEYCKIEPGYICSGTTSTCKVRPYCGNGIIDVGEQCDDWNTQNYDGCSSICKLSN